MGSGFTGDRDGLRPSVHRRDPYVLDRLKADARILQAELGTGWKVEVDTYAAGPRLVAQKWPPRADGLKIVEPTLEAARRSIAEHEREGR